MSSQAESRVSENVQDGVFCNGNAPLFSKDSSENAPVKQERTIKKARRHGKGSPRKSESSDNEVSALASMGNGISKKPIPFSKNSRKSRNTKKNTLPKGGAGGRGTWGKPGSEQLTDVICQDSHDPNYDSDQQDDYVVKEIAPELTEEDLPKAIQPILKEYLDHGDSKEVLQLLSQLNLSNGPHIVPELAVSLALDRHDPHRELTSRLISDLNVGRVVSSEDLGRGFDGLLRSLDDLTLDTPNAPVILGQFIARAVADDCLPKNFTESYKGKVTNKLVRTALEKAEVLLKLNQSIVKLDNVWGLGGGSRPVKFLTNKVVELLKEYLDSADVTEATACLKDLDVPHFHHELVYQAAVIAIEKSSDRATDLMVNLLQSLTSTNIITPDEFKKGVMRVYEDMPEICIDVPSAYNLLGELATKLHDKCVLSDRLFKDMPSRARKRFVSEGDGGKLKENSY